MARTGEQIVHDARGFASELDARVEGWLARLSLEEQVSLLSGVDAWRVGGVDALGLAPLVFSDGPAGVRGQSFVSGRSTSFPCGVALGATWDRDLVRRVGEALGDEAVARGVHVLLGPVVNLHRHPLGGRNFESFSEDPELTSQLAAAYVGGVQSRKVACCAKHYVGNDTEHERHTVSSRIADGPLRELYLAPFEALVEAGVWSVMASYNRVNGTHVSESPFLLHTVLRAELGFDGVVVSDWFAVRSTAGALRAGLDLEMPGPSRFRGEALLEAVGEGTVGADEVARVAHRVLLLAARTERAGHASAPPSPSAVRSLVREAGARSIVLLKNEGVLPLRPGPGARVALVGPGADIGQWQGSGSVTVNPAEVTGIEAGLRAGFGSSVELGFARGCVVPELPRPMGPPLLTTPEGTPGALVEVLARDGRRLVSSEVARQLNLVWLGQVVPGFANGEVTVRVRARWTPAESGEHELRVAGSGSVRVLVDGVPQKGVPEHDGGSAGDGAGAGADLVDDDLFDVWARAVSIPLRAREGVAFELDLELEPEDDRSLVTLAAGMVPPGEGLLEQATELAGAAEVTVVVAESPPGWETEGRDRPAMRLPGDQDELIEVLAEAGRRTVVVVNAGGPVEMPWLDAVDAVVQCWFPGQEIGDALADVLTGTVNPSGKLPFSIPARLEEAPVSAFYPAVDGEMTYGEGHFVGYRCPVWPPEPARRFAFGHGLSYSRFELGEPEVGVVGEGGTTAYEVRVPVRNVAGPKGREVVQVYLAGGGPGRPAIELKGFAVVEVGPGERAEAVVALSASRLRVREEGAWRPLEGPQTLRIGTSSIDLPRSARLDLPVAGPPKSSRRGDAAAGRGGKR